MFAASSAVAAAIVLFPTPPFPVKNSRRRSSSPGAGWITRAPRHRPVEPKPTLRPPASAAISTYAILSVGTPTRRPLLSVSHNMPLPFASAPLDRLRDDLDLIVGLDRQLAGGVHDADAYFHALAPYRRP